MSLAVLENSKPWRIRRAEFLQSVGFVVFMNGDHDDVPIGLRCFVAYVGIHCIRAQRTVTLTFQILKTWLVKRGCT
ncbi:unnamed protein product [Nippostrongylus brasiliensis]|uniref:DUF4222 domain-containing protein n=1 Tax=Nippostrongylus brasiliensis TaxID=27835 RepID=A0A0N4YUK7_NIPBR|nr:unnamed protein product [Nippostrongylus brasiliensis]